MEKQGFDQDPLVGRVALAVATFGGVGKIPWAPGTWGSLAGWLIFWPLADMPLVRLFIFATFLVSGVWAAGVTERILGYKDPRCVVIDEVCGMFIVALGMPSRWDLAFLGFILFRLFDIIKPFPVRHLERLPGGWGVMADDLACGVYASLLLLFVRLNFLH